MRAVAMSSWCATATRLRCAACLAGAVEPVRLGRQLAVPPVRRNNGCSACRGPLSARLTCDGTSLDKNHHCMQLLQLDLLPTSVYSSTAHRFSWLVHLL